MQKFNKPPRKDDSKLMPIYTEVQAGGNVVRMCVCDTCTCTCTSCVLVLVLRALGRRVRVYVCYVRLYCVYDVHCTCAACCMCVVRVRIKTCNIAPIASDLVTHIVTDYVCVCAPISFRFLDFHYAQE